MNHYFLYSFDLLPVFSLLNINVFVFLRQMYFNFACDFFLIIRYFGMGMFMHLCITRTAQMSRKSYFVIAC